MGRQIITKKFQCLLFCEGESDKKFIYSLIDLKKFKYHTKNWEFIPDNATGESPKTILEQCVKRLNGYSFHMVLCFIDLDKLKQDYPKKWSIFKKEFEKKYFTEYKISIIWQLDNLEEEIKKVLGCKCGKHKIHTLAKKEINKFINSDYYKRILKPIQEFEDRYSI